MAEGKNEVEIMAIVITNGDLYIYLNRYGKCRKTDNEAEALLYQNVDRAIAYMEIAPKKTRGYYVLDTETRKVLWSRQERKIERKRERVKYERKKFSIDTKKMLYLNAGGRCVLCGRKLTLEKATLDHIVAVMLIQWKIYRFAARKIIYLKDQFYQKTSLKELQKFLCIRWRRKTEKH